jgi:hypothetical protein
MQQDDERDLERALEEHARRIFNAKTEQERKKAEKELAEHVARPKQTDDLDKIAREFVIRLKRSASLPPGATPEQEEAFAPFLESVAAIPPHDKWHVEGFDLWTQHMVNFYFQYGAEPLCALLGLKALTLINPAPEIFTAATDAPDDIERARKTRLFVEYVTEDVVRIVQKALEYFLEALSGRLGSVLDETLHEIALRAINELEPELNTVGKEDVRRARGLVLDQWAKIEKVRLGTKDGRGGDRKSSKGMPDAERQAIADRKAALKPFWDYLISQFQKNDYESDVWDWLKNRDKFKEQCSTFSVTSMAILDSLIPDVLKRRPYWEKTAPDPMPEHLMPASFALIHAAREMGIVGDYWALKKAVGKIKK